MNILGSGSSGNSIFIGTDKVKLIIDAGLSCRETKRRLNLMGEKLSDIDALLISHEHHDHIVGASVISRRYEIPVYLNASTLEVLSRGNFHASNTVLIEGGNSFSIGDIEITPFSVPHDAADPLGFNLVCGHIKLGIAIDLGSPSHLVRERLRGCDLLVLEANHDIEMLKNGPYPWEVKQRVLSRLGHLSNEDAATLLKQIVEPRSQYLFLAHMSKVNNLPQLALYHSQKALREANNPLAKVFLTYQDKPSEIIKIRV